jgi:hypothetical protein
MLESEGGFSLPGLSLQVFGPEQCSHLVDPTPTTASTLIQCLPRDLPSGADLAKGQAPQGINLPFL